MIYIFILFFFNDTATTEIYTLSLHDALPILVDEKTKEAKIFAFEKQFGYLRSAKNNAKIAGVKINFSQKDVDWINEEFKEINAVATTVPRLTRYANKGKITENYKELFSQLKNKLKGKIVIVSDNLDEIKKYAKDFSVVEEREIMQGQECLKIVTFLNQ